MRIEVRDESEQRHLPPKRDTKLARAQRSPKPRLRVSGREPHCVSAKSETGFAVRHRWPPSPAGDRTKPLSRRRCDARCRRPRFHYRLREQSPGSEVARHGSCASREDRSPAGEGSECEPKTRRSRAASSTKRSPIKHGERSRRGPHVRRSRRRAGPRRADRREHAGPCCAVQRRGIKSVTPAELVAVGDE